MSMLSRKHHTLPKSALEIIPDVYQLSIKRANVILIVEEELTLSDTGFPGSSAQITDFIHRLGHSVAEISLIIITHNHFDHAGGLPELRRPTSARVAIHQVDITDTEEQTSSPGVVRRLLQTPALVTLRSGFSVQPSDDYIQLAGEEVIKPLDGLRVVHTGAYSGQH